MIPVTWSLTFFRPHERPSKMCAIVWCDHRPVDFMTVGIWRKRVGWLPTWWPFNMRFDEQRLDQLEAMAALRKWVAERNVVETQASANSRRIPVVQRPLEEGGRP